MAAHVGLTAFLYALLTAVRAPTVWGVGRVPDALAVGLAWVFVATLGLRGWLLATWP
jgi:hypothetical protein